jgi:hypothetical protein
LFLLNPNIVLKKIKQYSDSESDNKLSPYHKSFFQTLKTIWHSLELGKALIKRIDHKLSSLTHKHMESY